MKAVSVIALVAFAVSCYAGEIGDMTSSFDDMEPSDIDMPNIADDIPSSGIADSGPPGAKRPKTDMHSSSSSKFESTVIENGKVMSAQKGGINVTDDNGKMKVEKFGDAA